MQRPAPDGIVGGVLDDVAPEYRSPYALTFRTVQADREAGLDAWPWNSPGAQAVVDPADWYSAATARRWNSWGPRARVYPPPTHPFTGAVARERLLGVAGGMIGLDYQHHHVPVWDPPPEWPWKEVRSGRRGPGVDCSNFVSFVYSFALGIGLPTNVTEQAELHRTGAADGLPHGVRAIRSSDYDAFCAQLLPGDVVYIASGAGAIVHCVLWLGDLGTGPDATPLVLDCASEPRLDARSVRIPAGVRIRPYRRVGWYARATAHAHRIIPD